MTGNEVSQILFSLLLSHFGATGHRPRWIAVGVLLSALACFLLASPHAFYGSGKDALALTQEYAWLNGADPEILSMAHNAPKAGQVYDELDSFTPPETTTVLNFNTIRTRGQVTLCRREDAPTHDSCDDQDTNLVPLVLLFISQFVSGIGILLFFTLGGPYLDDSTKRKNIAMLFGKALADNWRQFLNKALTFSSFFNLGITVSLRLVGPTFGFLLASAALKMYVNPLMTPLITPENPRWIGAWWLGKF